VTERLRLREIDDDEGRRLVRIIRRGSGSVVTWRRAQMVLLAAQGMDVPAIAKVAFTSEDRGRDVIRNFNADGFSWLYPKYKGGHPPKFTLRQRREIKKTDTPPGAAEAPHDLTQSLHHGAHISDEEKPHHSPAQPGDRGQGHRVNLPRPLDSRDPYGCGYVIGGP